MLADRSGHEPSSLDPLALSVVLTALLAVLRLTGALGPSARPQALSAARAGVHSIEAVTLIGRLLCLRNLPLAVTCEGWPRR